MTTHPPRIGLKLSPQIYPIATHRAVWHVADDAGFDGLWGFDHLLALGGDDTKPVFEGGRCSRRWPKQPSAYDSA